MSTSDGLPTGSERERETVDYEVMTAAFQNGGYYVCVTRAKGAMAHSDAVVLASEVRAALAGSGEREPDYEWAMALGWMAARNPFHERMDFPVWFAAVGAKRISERYALASAPPEASEEPEHISSKTWDALEAIRARIARHGYDDLQREMADIIDRLVPPVEPEGEER